jgi:hypothetical protein
MEGVTPAAINLILIQIKKREAFKQNAWCCISKDF